MALDIPLSEKVVDTVAKREEVSPVDLDPLYDVIDPEALDSLFRNSEDGPADSERRIVFQYSGYHVSVSGSREVRIEEIRQSSESVPGSATDTMDG